MNAKQQAVIDLKRFSHLFRGLLEIGDQLQEVGSLEAAAEQADRSLSETRKTTADLDRKIEAQRKTLSDNEAKIAEMMVKAGKEQSFILSTAKSEAESVMASAKASADKIVQHGRDEAKRLHDEATNALSDTHNQLKVSTLELEHLNDAIAKAQTRYDGINAELKKLRERL